MLTFALHPSYDLDEEDAPFCEIDGDFVSPAFEPPAIGAVVTSSGIEATQPPQTDNRIDWRFHWSPRLPDGSLWAQAARSFS